MSREQTPPHRGMLKGFLVQGLDNGLERPTNPTEPAYKHPITGSPIGDLLWAHRAAIIQIEGRDYDSLISANPDAKLRYMDDDNELVIVSIAELQSFCLCSGCISDSSCSCSYFLPRLVHLWSFLKG